MLELPTHDWIAYRSRLKDERAAGWITADHYLVLRAIADLNAAGDWEPTVAKIAVNAGCSPRTVRRARARAQARGLLNVQARFELVDARPQQRANRYELVLPKAPCLPKPRKRRGGQPVRPREQKVSKKAGKQGLPKESNLLIARLQAIRARQMAEYARRGLL